MPNPNPNRLFCPCLTSPFDPTNKQTNHPHSGPPNCPTQDQGGRGLLKASLRLLSEKERALRAQLQQRQEGAGGQWGREEPDGGGGGGGGGLVGLAARALAAVWNARW